MSNDGCLVRPKGRTKTASATVYLMEELGDARMRCDQLVRYIGEAMRLVEASQHREHFFEVAGHLIQAVPTTAFKLQKALQAVALAANRIDYEELKTDLRPEKVEQLESVLEDVRIRQVQHRSEPPMTTNKDFAQKLRQIAATTREYQLPQHEVVKLIVALEQGQKTAEPKVPTADYLDRFAAAVENDGAFDRQRLAACLRRMVGDVHVQGHVGMTRQAIAPQFASNPIFTQAGSREDVMEGFKKENPALTDAQLEEIGDQWEKNKNVVTEGKTAAEAVALRWKAGSKDEDKQSKFEKGQPADPTENMSPEDAKEWERMNEEHGDKLKKKAFAGKQIDDGLQKAYNDGVKGGEGDADDLKHAVMNVAQAAKALGDLSGKPGATGLIPGSFDNLATAAWEVAYYLGATHQTTKTAAKLDVLNKNELTALFAAFDKATSEKEINNLVLNYRGRGVQFGADPHPDLHPVTYGLYLAYAHRDPIFEHALRFAPKTASKDEDKQSKFEKGQPADPTKNMSPEDAKEWKANTEEHGDKFKTAAMSKPVAAIAKGLLKCADDMYGIRSPMRGVWQMLADLSSDATGTVNTGWYQDRSVDETKNAMHALDRQIGEVAREMENLARLMAKPRTAAKDDPKQSKFEKGQPADPTENMSPEDAKEWERMNEEHGDKLKEAAEDDWVAWVKDAEGHVLHFEGPAPKASVQRKVKSGPWQAIVDEGGKTNLIPLRGIRVELGSLSPKWLSKLPKQEKDQLDGALKSAKTASDPWKVEAAAPTKSQVQRLMKQHNIPGEIRGSGSKWEVEVPDENAKDALAKVLPGGVGGFRTGYGAWVIRPGYGDVMGDPNDPSSKWHYASGSWKVGATQEKDVLEVARQDIEHVANSFPSIFKAKLTRSGGRSWGPGSDWHYRSKDLMYNVAVAFHGGDQVEVTVTKAPLKADGEPDLGSLVEDSKFEAPEQAGAAALALAKEVARRRLSSSDPWKA